MKGKENEKHGERGEEGVAPLRLIFGYYCKLNTQKMKHRMFEDVNEKALVMDLHEFMTFCKNFQITAKQHRRTDNNVLSQFLDAKHQEGQTDSNASLIKTDHSKQKLDPNTILTEKQERTSMLKEKTQALMAENQFLHVPDAPNIEEDAVSKPMKLPLNYINEKRLAQIFKKHASQEGEINLDSFISILRTISQQMYETTSCLSSTKDSKSGTAPAATDSLPLLLVFFNLDTRQNALETFAKVNEFHGNMEHLALLRSPVKKLVLKNDPLGKYARKEEENKENNSKSRSRLIGKLEKPSAERLPQVAKAGTLKREGYGKTELKSVKRDDLEEFIVAHRSQIEHLNHSYLKNSIPIFNEVSTNRSFLNEPEPRPLPSYGSQASSKKYSERHRDKVIGDIQHKQIFKLIDTSSLYDDQIFNKYVQLNYKSDKGGQRVRL